MQYILAIDQGTTGSRAIVYDKQGAAYLAGLAIGHWEDQEDIRKFWREDRAFSPRMSRDKADSLYRGWQDAVRRTLTR